MANKDKEENEYQMLRVYKTDIDKLKKFKYDLKANSMTDAVNKIISFYEKIHKEI